MTDPTVEALRAQISAIDREILAAFNRRLELVAQLKRHKAERGLEFLDPDRERRMLAELRAANDGTLSAEGVATLLQAVLDLTKSEV